MINQQAGVFGKFSAVTAKQPFLTGLVGLPAALFVWNGLGHMATESAKLSGLYGWMMEKQGKPVTKPCDSGMLEISENGEIIDKIEECSLYELREGATYGGIAEESLNIAANALPETILMGAALGLILKFILVPLLSAPSKSVGGGAAAPQPSPAG